MKCNHDITITDDTIGYELVSCSKCGMKKMRVAAYVTNPTDPEAVAREIAKPDGFLEIAPGALEARARRMAGLDSMPAADDTVLTPGGPESKIPGLLKVNGSSEGTHAIDGVMVEGDG